MLQSPMPPCIAGVYNQRSMRLLTTRGGFLFTAMMAGCASAGIQDAVHDRVTDDVVHRVYVLVDHSAASLNCVDYGELLRASLSDALAKEGIESQGRTGRLTRVEDPQTSEIRAYHADAVLFVQATGGVPFHYKLLRGKCGGSLAGYTSLAYDVTVLGSDSDTSLWHATASNSGGIHSIEARFRRMAVTIVRRLKTDGVLGKSVD
jgi:hypothetical protein